MTFFPGISVVYAHEGYTYRDLLFFIYVSCMYSELYRFHVLMTFCHFVPFFPPSPPPPLPQTFPRPWSVTRFIMSLLSHLSRASLDSFTKTEICLVSSVASPLPA